MLQKNTIIKNLEYLAIKADEGLDKIAQELINNTDLENKQTIYEQYIERRKYYQKIYKQINKN